MQYISRVSKSIMQWQNFFVHKVSKRTVLLVIEIIIIGVLYSVTTGRITDLNARKDLLVDAKNITTFINPADITALSGTAADVGNPIYERLKRSLEHARMVNKESRFIYILGYRNGDMFFFADSEPIGSKDYSAPGDMYDDATPYQIYNFVNGVSFTEGPYADAWGSWISGYAPIRDANGQVIAVLGIDMPANYWGKRIFYSMVPSIGTAGILIVILFLHYRSLRRDEKKLLQQIRKKNK